LTLQTKAVLQRQRSRLGFSDTYFYSCPDIYAIKHYLLLQNFDEAKLLPPVFKTITQFMAGFT